MRRVPIIVGICGLLAIVGFVLEFETTPSAGTAAETLAPTEKWVTDVPNSTATPELPLILGAPVGVRAVVSFPVSEPVTEDPCASVRANLEVAWAANAEYEVTITTLREQLATAMLEIEFLMFPEDTPYGAFLMSYEAGEINNPNTRVSIQSWLQQFPVFLRPGEATWIAERSTRKDWRLYGPSSEEALILFLGTDRLIAELPPARVAELREEYAEERIFD